MKAMFDSGVDIADAGNDRSVARRWSYFARMRAVLAGSGLKVLRQDPAPTSVPTSYPFSFRDIYALQDAPAAANPLFFELYGRTEDSSYPYPTFELRLGTGFDGTALTGQMGKVPFSRTPYGQGSYYSNLVCVADASGFRFVYDNGFGHGLELTRLSDPATGQPAGACMVAGWSTSNSNTNMNGAPLIVLPAGQGVAEGWGITGLAPSYMADEAVGVIGPLITDGNVLYSACGPNALSAVLPGSGPAFGGGVYLTGYGKRTLYRAITSRAGATYGLGGTLYLRVE